MALEQKLDMGWLNFGNKGISEHTKDYIDTRNSKEEEINLSRRNFGKQMLGLGAGALVGTTTMYSKDAKAYDLNNLPPGFKICKDPVLVNVYIMMLRDEQNKSTIIKGALTGNGRDGDIHTGFVNNNTPLLEPAYWFTLNYYNYNFQTYGGSGMVNFEDLKFIMTQVKKNPSMYNWAKGINHYFKTWIDKRQSMIDISGTETYLLRAIFTAAGKNENEIEDYKKLDLQLKERKLQEIMSSLEKQNYDNQLIAAWSVYTLGIHYEVKLKNISESDIIYNQIEMPLRKINSKFKIRGPPSYGL